MALRDRVITKRSSHVRTAITVYAMSRPPQVLVTELILRNTVLPDHHILSHQTWIDDPLTTKYVRLWSDPCPTLSAVAGIDAFRIELEYFFVSPTLSLQVWNICMSATQAH